MKTRTVAPLLCLLLAATAVAEDPPPLETRVFDVSTLLSTRADSSVESLGLGPGQRGWFEKDEEGDENRLLYDEQLEELIETFVEPETWLREGVSTEWLGRGRLVIRAPRSALDATAALLGEIYLEATRRIDVRADLVTLDAAGAARLDTAGALPALLGGRLDANARSAVLAEAGKAGSTRLQGAVSLRPGRLGQISLTSSVSYVSDMDVEIAQGSGVGDPIVDFLTEGWLLHVRPILLTDGGIWLEAFQQAAALDGPIRRVDPEAEPLGTIDFPSMGVERCVAAGRVKPGETFAVVRRGPGELVALLLSPRVVGGAARDASIGFVPTSILTRLPVAGRAAWHVDDGGEWSEFPLDSRTGFMGSPLVTLEEGLSVFDEPSELAVEPAGLVVAAEQGLFVENDAALVRTRDRVAAWERRVARSYRVRLSIASEDGAKTRPVADLSLEVASGRQAFWQVGVERAFLADWDVEVAQEARIGDPIIGHAFGGLVANLRLDPSPDGDRIAGRLALALVDLDREIVVHRSGNEKTGIVEIPRARQLLLDRELVLEPGKAVEIDGGRGQDGRRLVLTLEVTAR